MTLLIRLTITGVFIAAMLIGASKIPPFPAQYGQLLTQMFGQVLILDNWLPVRLTINLFAWIAIIDAVVYGFRFVRWAKSWLLGEANPG